MVRCPFISLTVKKEHEETFVKVNVAASRDMSQETMKRLQFNLQSLINEMKVELPSHGREVRITSDERVFFSMNGKIVFVEEFDKENFATNLYNVLLNKKEEMKKVKEMKRNDLLFILFLLFFILAFSLFFGFLTSFFAGQSA